MLLLERKLSSAWLRVFLFPIFPFQAGHVSIHQYFIASHTGLSSTMPAKHDCLVFHRLPQELTPFPAKFCCLLGATPLGWPVSSSVHIHSFRAMAIVPYPGPDRETSRLPILIIFAIQYSPRPMCPHGTKCWKTALNACAVTRPKIWDQSIPSTRLISYGTHRSSSCLVNW